MPAQKPRENAGQKKARKRNRAGKIDDSDKRAENQPVRPARAMREKRLIRIPQKAKNAPSRVLLALRVEVWTEHQAAENKRRRNSRRERNAFGNLPSRRKSRRSQ